MENYIKSSLNTDATNKYFAMLMRAAYSKSNASCCYAYYCITMRITVLHWDTVHIIVLLCFLLLCELFCCYAYGCVTLRHYAYYCVYMLRVAMRVVVLLCFLLLCVIVLVCLLLLSMLLCYYASFCYASYYCATMRVIVLLSRKM